MSVKMISENNKDKKMKVEIWSDFMCPFCYIGKRKFEKGLEEFNNGDQLEIVWRSFQLDPGMQYEPGKTIHQVLAGKKGWSLEHAKQINQHVTSAAGELGLEYNFDKAVPANTFHAHRLSHLAAEFNLQNEMEERLFSAYFSEGKNIGDIATLFELAVEVGLPEADVRKMLETDSYSGDVLNDGEEAQQLRIHGVPFFVIDGRYGISGAQSPELFTNALQTAWKERESENVLTPGTENQTTECTINGNC